MDHSEGNYLVQFGMTLAYAVLGLGVFAVAFLVFNAVTPFSVRKEIEDDQSIALAVIFGSVLIGLAIIIAAAIS